ncbi:MAG: PfkB family carbohydrate kinase [Canibacter sp.]
MSSSPGQSKWEMDRRPADVLLIGSQVVYGFVGTNASSTVLAEAGLRTATAPTILLSSLPHYDSVHTQAMPAQWLGEALADIATLGVLDEVATVHTGYFASPEQVVAVASWLAPILHAKPKLRLVVDPTLGDADVGFYTDPRVAEALREHLVPLATGLTPNAFELDLLNEDGDPVNLLGERGEWIIVTGGSDDPINNIVVTRDGTDSFVTSRVGSNAKGTGDVFTAALVAALHRGETVQTAARTAAAEVTRRLEASQAALR